MELTCCDAGVHRKTDHSDPDPGTPLSGEAEAAGTVTCQGPRRESSASSRLALECDWAVPPASPSLICHRPHSARQASAPTQYCVEEKGNQGGSRRGREEEKWERLGERGKR